MSGEPTLLCCAFVYGKESSISFEVGYFVLKIYGRSEHLGLFLMQEAT